jgi:predicted PurR-regulated permease PerM
VKRIVGQLRGVRGRPKAEPDVTADPTPIRISKRIRTALILAVLALLGLVIWFVPSVLTTVVGGFALALALSFPVRWLSWLMPRGLAILIFLAVIIGGSLGGIFGVIVAVPSLAVLRVIFDFFRVRLTTEDQGLEES